MGIRTPALYLSFSQTWAATLRRVGLDATEAGLALAFIVSFLLHGLLLVTHFTFPDAEPRKASPMEVVLVNAKSAQRPKDALVKAQANLDRGGNTEQNRIAKSPLPASQQDRSGDALIQMQRRLHEAEDEQRRLLALSKSLPTPHPQIRNGESRTPQPDKATTPSGADLAQSALAMARMEAQIAREVDAYNKLPRKKFIGARAQGVVEAQYAEDWRQKIERVGNLNYPEEARGRIYGSLLVTVEINADGTLASVEITRSSGKKVLDDAAKRIVRLASPFSAFPAELRRSTDILVITRHWTFDTADRLQAE